MSASRRVLPSRSATGTFAEVLRTRDGLDVSDVEPLVDGLHEAAGPDHRAVGVAQQAGVESVGGGVHDLLQGDVVLGELRRVHLHVALRAAARPRWRPGRPRERAASAL